MHAAAGVTWIKVDPPRFDLVGLLLSSLSLTLLLALLALLLGVVFGVLLIRRRRPHGPLRAERLSLHRP